MTQPFRVFTRAQRPELEERKWDAADCWPPFILHLERTHPDFCFFRQNLWEHQLYLCDAEDRLVAYTATLPLTWNGTEADLPAGWADAIERGVRDRAQGRRCTALCALGTEIDPHSRGRGYSKYVLRAMRQTATCQGLDFLIDPVRPIWKSRYPLIPMAHYLEWKRADDSPFDPWLRVHWREGGQVLGIAQRSLVCEGTLEQWEQWAGMPLPGSGCYVVADALQPVTVSCADGIGHYEEPHVWTAYGA